MKKIIATLLTFVVAFMATLALSSPASATGGHSVDGKPVTVCHATGSAQNPYVKLENVPVVQFFGNNGHNDHSNDIWAEFTYYEKVRGEWVERTEPAQGNTSLLQYEDCKAPVVKDKIAAPAVSVNDPCVTKNDSVTPVVSDKYTAVVTQNGLVYTVVATATGNNVFDPALSAGWTLSENNTVATKTFRLTNVDCELPETGSKATNVVGGVVVVAILIAAAVFLLRRRKV